jgi:hypothetical protein
MDKHKQHRKAPSFEETTPNQTAYVLFNHLKRGDKVAITSRFANDPVLQEHVAALENRGIHVRVIVGNGTSQRRGIEDFCFLLGARKELVGNFRSTFAFWAALLGDAENIDLYTIKSPGLKLRFGPFIKRFFTGNFTWQLPDVSRPGNLFSKHLRMSLVPMEKQPFG